MRRFAGLIRRPLVWLPLFFFGFAWFFQVVVAPPPRFTVRTGAASVHAWISDFPSTWGTPQDVSNDGTSVTVCIQHGRVMDIQSRLEVWDTQTGTERTPPLWKDAEWNRLFSEAVGADTGLIRLPSTPTGNEFLSDEAAWPELRRRLVTARAQALNDLRKTLRPVDDDEVRNLFPEGASFSPDGRLFAYAVRNGLPLYLVSSSLGDGTVVEDVRTGERLALLPGVTDGIVFGPDNRTAVSVNHQKYPEGEQPRLTLWDLATSERRAELFLPEVEWPLRPEYSTDGRYVFAWYLTPLSFSKVRWWDTATGRLVGQVDNTGPPAVLDGGRVLVTKSSPVFLGSRLVDGYRLCFWDVETGEKLRDWDLATLSDEGAWIGLLESSESGRYLAADLQPNYYGRNRRSGLLDLVRIVRSRWGPSASEDRQVLLWDVAERREEARLPGSSARLSRNGRWLATIDEAGVVRVWEVPLQRPWGLILGYSAVAALACWAGLVAAGRLGRRWRNPSPLAG
jgi:WD40 repeat protein